MIAAVPAKPWRRISGRRRRARTTGTLPGAGADPDRVGTRARALTLARRSLSDATEIAYYICAGPRRTTLTGLATVAGSRWRVEECFQQAKNEAGLDQYQVRTYRAWYAHTTLSMLGLSGLDGTKPKAVKGESVSPNRA